MTGDGLLVYPLADRVLASSIRLETVRDGSEDYDLLDAVADSDLPIRPITDLKAELDRICGVPARPALSDQPVAVVKWVDGTILDTVWGV